MGNFGCSNGKIKKTLSETLIHSNLCDTVRKLPKVCMLRPKDNFYVPQKKLVKNLTFKIFF